MRNHPGAVSRAILLGVLLTSMSLSGAEITGILGVLSPGGALVRAGFQTMQLNNDEFPPVGGGGINPNGVALLKEFTAVAPIDVLFQVKDSNGTTEYDVLDRVVNLTGFRWYDFHMQLGFFINGAFVLANPNSGLDFDTPHRNPPADFNPMDVTRHDPNRIDAKAANLMGTIPNNTFADFLFSMDIPDFNGAYMDDRIYDPVNKTWTFVLRQTPTVPEPGSMAFTGLAVIGFCVFRSRARRARRF